MRELQQLQVLLLWCAAVMTAVCSIAATVEAQGTAHASPEEVNWKDVMSALKGRDEPSLLGLRGRGLLQKNTIAPFHHVINYFAEPAQEVAKHQAKSIRRTLEVEEQEDHEGRRPQGGYRRRAGSNRRSDGGTDLRRNHRYDPMVMSSSATVIKTHNKTVPVVVAKRINETQAQSRTEGWQPRLSFNIGDIRTTARTKRPRHPKREGAKYKKVAILHIPGGEKKHLSSADKVELEQRNFQNHRKSNDKMMTVVETEMPYLIIPHTGKRIPLSNLSNPFVTNLLKAERRQDSWPANLVIRPIRNLLKFIDSRQPNGPVPQHPIKRQQTVPLSKLNLNNLPSGDFVIEFGPPKGEDVMEELPEKTAKFTSENTVDTSSTHSTSNQQSVFVQNTDAQKFIPVGQLQLQTSPLQAIDANILAFQDDFPPSQSFNSIQAVPQSQTSNNIQVFPLDQKTQPIRSIVNNLNTDSNGGFRAPQLETRATSR